MTRAGFIRVVDCELDEPLSVDAVAEAVAAPPDLIARLIRMELIETIPCDDSSTLLPASANPRLRRMRRSGVTFASTSRARPTSSIWWNV